MDTKADISRYPRFDLSRLLKTVFAPSGGERVAVLIDLENPETVADMAFLEDPENQNPATCGQRHRAQLEIDRAR